MSGSRPISGCSGSAAAVALITSAASLWNSLRWSGLACSLMCLLAVSARAEDVWTDTSFSILAGNAEIVSEKTVLTYRVEHISSNETGTFFALLEHLRDNRDYEETYVELLGRFSLSHLSGSELSFGPVTDVHLAYTLEMGGSPDFDFHNHLYGFGLDLEVPGFDYFESNFFYADNKYGDSDLRLELVFGRVFEFTEQVVIFDGLTSWSSAESDRAASVRFNPQLRIDAGRWLGLAPRTLEAGIEYSWWHNKYGLKDIPGLETNENEVSLLLRLYL